MTAATSTRVLFSVPADVQRHLPRKWQGFTLLDDPEDTQAAIAADELLRELDAEAGALLRARRRAESKESRAYFLREANRSAGAAQDLADALRDLNRRWSGGSVRAGVSS